MAVVAWPPPTPPNTRANSTLQVDAHPLDHNRIADALDTLIARFAPASFRLIGGGAGQSAANNTSVTCTFTTEQSDPLNLVAAGVFTCPAAWAGRWLFEWCVSWAANTTGVRQCVGIHSNNNQYANQLQSASSAFAASQFGSATVVMAAGDTLKVVAYHNAGVALTINPNATSEYFQGRWVGT